jgi:hypothetical protein
MFDQYASVSGAPGMIAASPTIATSRAASTSSNPTTRFGASASIPPPSTFSNSERGDSSAAFASVGLQLLGVRRARRHAGGHRFGDGRADVAADVGVKLGDRARVPAQRRDLADHVHALALLRGGVDGADRIAVALEPLRRDAKPAEVQLLELRPRDLRVDALRREPRLLGRELAGELGVCTARRVARRRLEQHGALARDRLLLKRGLDRAALDGFVREQIRRAHEHADARALRGERRRERRDHRGRSTIVDAAREQHVELGHVLAREQALHLLLPQHEARARSDVTAALAAFEHEAARAVFQEQIQQARRRHVQERRRALRFERRRLRRPATRDQRDRHADLANHLELRLAHFGRHEAQDADAPRQLADELLGLEHQLANLGAAHQREREERQAAGFGDRRGEPRTIADARHRALRDRIAQAVTRRERCIWRDGPMLRCELEPARDRTGDRTRDAAGRDVHIGERLRERGILADRQQLRVKILAAERRARRDELLDRQVGPREHAARIEDRRLAAIHRGNRGTNLRG